MIQKVKDKTWIDESGAKVPVEYVTAGNRLRERHAATLVRGAKEASKKLQEFKKQMNHLCTDIYLQAMHEFKVDPKNKGNFTWFNFDRSIKIEVSVSERIDFDDLAISAAKEKLDSFLDESLDSKIEFLKNLVTDAFSTSRGKIDTKKVMQLMKYRSKISHPKFQEAINILTDGIRKPDSKTYFRIWERDSHGAYALIELNFSAL